MLQHLDDTNPFTPDAGFRAGVAARHDRLIRRRRRIAAGVGGLGSAALIVGLAVIASGPAERFRLIDNGHGAQSDPTEALAGVGLGGTEPTPGAFLDTSGGRPAPGVAPGTSTPREAAVAPVGAVNILLVASDSRSCVPADSPYADAFGSPDVVAGARGDTMIVVRLDPIGTTPVAVLSLPRDLWVEHPDRVAKGRLSATFDTLDPTRSIRTIVHNFAIPIDHYVHIDFCGFIELIDVIGGVTVPVAGPVRDRNSGVSIDAYGCHTFGGDEALAWVRSRSLQMYDPTTQTWVSDGSSDFGRTDRQRDLLLRMWTQLASSLGTGLDGFGIDDPADLPRLLAVTRAAVTTDDKLTIASLLGWFELLATVDAGAFSSARLAVVSLGVNGTQVLQADLEAPGMPELLAHFRGTRPTSPTDPASPTDPTGPTGPANTPQPIAPAADDGGSPAGLDVDAGPTQDPLPFGIADLTC